MIRDATEADLPAIRELFRAFMHELGDLPHRDDDTEEDLAKIEAGLGKKLHVLLAEEEGEPVGLAVADKQGTRVGYLGSLYVRPDSRGSGLSAELVREAIVRLRAEGVEVLELDVLEANTAARAIYERWGFTPVQLNLAAPIDTLEQRLVRSQGPTFGSVHVQTDDAGAVERAVQKALPRLGRSEGSAVTGPRNGWVAVHAELLDREPKVVQRLAKELSYVLGGVVLAIGVDRGAVVRYTLFDRGGDVDEYASVPEYDGPLPPGDVVALGANPRVVARLTGADPNRVRDIARTAKSPADLPPATELLEAIADVMGVAEAGHGWIASS
ncbi:MAG TPA: GNAT family N-acetyltransferase [Gaiellaceae bacterium]|nr:GNAT family N-acetyltransferase [Gaiellaceae bacterium]